MDWKLSVVLGLVMVAVFPAISLYVWGTSSSDILTEDKAVVTVINFLRRSPTFRFDGKPDTVRVVDVETIRMPWTWEVTVAFVCRSSGYGDRTGKITLPVLTPHEIKIVVSKGFVISAVIDGKWDEINQRTIS